uniref:Uncharacterized protein n=1 Tax=Leersia perrieri TaxID=77586 RepID=A0A0D9VQM3_9ORYZ
MVLSSPPSPAEPNRFYKYGVPPTCPRSAHAPRTSHGTGSIYAAAFTSPFFFFSAPFLSPPVSSHLVSPTELAADFFKGRERAPPRFLSFLGRGVCSPLIDPSVIRPSIGVGFGCGWGLAVSAAVAEDGAAVRAAAGRRRGVQVPAVPRRCRIQGRHHLQGLLRQLRPRLPLRSRSEHMPRP